MTVLRSDPQSGLAMCADADGARISVETALVEPVAPGDRLLVHAGTAIAKSAGAESVGSSAGSQLSPKVATGGSGSSELPDGGPARVELAGVVREVGVES
jgi:hydrogenase maturation factor